MDLMDTQPAAAGPGTGPGAGPGPDGDADGLWGTEGQGVGLGGAAASDDELHVLRVNLAADEGDQATAGTGQQVGAVGCVSVCRRDAGEQTAELGISPVRVYTGNLGV